MGNCRSSSTSCSTAVDKLPSTPPHQRRRTPDNDDETVTNASSLMVLDVLLPVVLPALRREFSRSLIKLGYILRDEKRVARFDINADYRSDDDDNGLPLLPLVVNVRSVRPVEYGQLRVDMESAPEFGWPEADRAEELMKRRPDGRIGMVVLDLLGVDIEIRLNRGIEIALPVKGPIGMKGDIEIGSGGSIEKGWVRLKGTYLRVWFLNDTGTIHIAFMDRPDAIIPFFHLNLDRGRGDFMESVYDKPGTSFDGAFLNMICMFSPGMEKLDRKRIGDLTAKVWDSAMRNLTPSKVRKPLKVDMTSGMLRSVQIARSGVTTSALLNESLPLLLSVMRQILSRYLVDEGRILRDEIPVTSFDEGNNNLIKPLLAKVGEVQVVDYVTLREDMDSDPKFEWPEREDAKVLMETLPRGGTGMAVLDLLEVEIEIKLGRGIELTFPVEGPLGIEIGLEIGSGGSINEASLRLIVPKLRIWFVRRSRKVFIAFMGRPDIIPHLHINADRGNGDFLNKTFTESGTLLDDVIEIVLSGFGPQVVKHKRSAVKSVAGDALGKILLSAMSKFTNVGLRKPIVVDMKEKFQQNMDRVEMSVLSALGRPRPVDVIKSDIERLQREHDASRNWIGPSDHRHIQENPQEPEMAESDNYHWDCASCLTPKLIYHNCFGTETVLRPGKNVP